MTHTLVKPPGGVPCPECAVPCVPLNCGPVVVDLCRKCGGIWFDEREIGIFRSKLRELDLTQLTPQSVDSDGYEITVCECPRCRIVLDPFTYGVNTDVKPLKCPRCHGIWLNARQLKAFLKLARVSQEIHPHVVGLLEAMDVEAKERAKWDRLGSFGDALNAEVHYRRSIWRRLWDWWPF